jgi:26S proteasome regulatory subunit T1
MVREIF